MSVTQSLADVKAHLSAVVDDVEKTHQRVIITRNGRPAAVLIAVDDLERLEETLDILSVPGAVADLREAEEVFVADVDPDGLRRLVAARLEREGV